MSSPHSAAISASEEARPAAPQSCSDSTSPRSVSSTETSISFLPVNGSPTWTDGPLVRVVLAELLAREHARAADPVAARSSRRRGRRGGRPRSPSRVVSRSVGSSPTHIALTRQLSRVGRVEDGLAADGRDPGRVAVGADPGDGAVEVVVGRAEAQPVEQRDRPRAHRDDVAQDPADPGRGALERLDRRGVVVALDLERDRLAVAEVEHARVLARPLQHALARGRKPLQQPRRVLVAAVLRPEQREDGELEVVRLPRRAAHRYGRTRRW